MQAIPLSCPHLMAKRPILVLINRDPWAAATASSLPLIRAVFAGLCPPSAKLGCDAEGKFWTKRKVLP